MLEKKWVQHSLAILGMFLIALIFCKPVLEGEVLVASDNLQTVGGLKESLDYRKMDKVGIAWSNSMFSGMPFYHGNNPNKIVKYSNIFRQGDRDHSYDILFALMIGFYLLALSLGASPMLAAIISVGFAFAGFNIMSMEHGHFYKIRAMSNIAGVLAGLFFLLRKKWLAGSIIFIIYTSLLIGINHTQITYYGMIIGVISGLFFMIPLLVKKEYKTVLISMAIMLGSLLLAVGSNALIFNQYLTAEATIRGGQSELTKAGDADKPKSSGLDKDYASSWSMDIVEIPTYFIPHFAGGTSSQAFVSDRDSKSYKALVSKGGKDANKLAQYSSGYWGNQPFVGGGFYMGATLFMLFLLFLIANKNDNKKYWMIASFLIILFFALGKNFSAFFDLVFNHLPLYNKFRVPSMTNLVMQIIIATGALLFLVELTENAKVDKKLITKSLIGVVVAVVLFVLVSPMLFSFESRALAEQGVELPGWYEDALRKDRIALMHKSAIRSIVFMVLMAGTIWLYVSQKLKSKIVFLLIIGGLISVDLIGNASNHIKWDRKRGDTSTFASFQSPKKAYAILNPSEADIQIKQDPDIHYRVYNTTRGITSDALTSYHHKSIGGYHGAKLRRYQELIENQLSKGNIGVFNMLNTKYFIVSNENRLVAQRNPDALGNAWFVNRIQVVENGNEEMAALNEPFNAKDVAVVQNKYMTAPGQTSFEPAVTDYIKLTSYHPDKMEYEYSSESGGFAVFSEIYYELKNGDGWKCYINGDNVPIIKTDFLLRGVFLEAGKNDIEFVFQINYYRKLQRIGRIFFMLTMLSLVGLAGWGIKSKMDT